MIRQTATSGVGSGPLPGGPGTGAADDMRTGSAADLLPGHSHVELPPCGALPLSGGSVCFRVWAPSARSVELVLSRRVERDLPGEGRAIPMLPEPGGYFVHTETGADDDWRYAFRLDGGETRPDPLSRFQPEGIHRPSALFWPDRYRWNEGDWKGVARPQLVIYELHVGTFTPQGTFEAIIGRLEELRTLGVTAIELMPVAQFPGTRSWGYDGVHPFAVQNSYGGPEGFCRLIDACHRTGLAVILDVVYNHFGPEGNYFAEFGPYFTDRHRTPWGRAINYDGRGSDPVRAVVLDNVRFWIRHFHVDGLRLDAVHAIYDSSPRHILAEIKEAADEEARRLGRTVHVIAESDLNDVRLLEPPEAGGYGLDAQQSDDFHHALHTLLTGERATYYQDFGRPEQLVKALNQTFVYDGVYSPFRGRRHGRPAGGLAGDRFIISIQNHDQIGNRPAGDRLTALLEPSQLRLSAGLLLLAPQIPMLFMGEEYGETHPFPYFCSFEDPGLAEATRRGRRDEFIALGAEDEVPDPLAVETFESAKLSWSWTDGSLAGDLRQIYYDLLAIRRYWLPLRAALAHESYLLESWHEFLPVVRLTRQAGEGEKKLELTAWFNLSRQPQTLPEGERPEKRPLLCSEDWRYGGSRAQEDPCAALLPFEFWIMGPVMEGSRLA